MRFFPPNLNRFPAGWNLPTLVINAAQIITKSLSAITANIGNLVMGNNGSIAIGETAYATGAGIWMGIDPSGNPQFSIQDKNGNFINIAMNSGGVLAISSSGLANALTSKQVDDQGWRNTGIFGQISGLPTTRGGYGITDAQGTLPNATTVGQVLQRDNGGAPYFSAKYGTETNAFVASIIPSVATLTSTTYIQVGVTVGFQKPATPSYVSVFCYFKYLGTATGLQLGLIFQRSLDGGATWGDTNDEGPYTLTTQGVGATHMLRVDTALTGSGDFQIRLKAANGGGTGTITMQEGHVLCIVCPNSSFYTIAGALAAVVPSTATGNCTATYPTTTCTVSANVTVTPSGGTPPYTYSWSVVSGAGTITAGSTSQTCAVSDTETATTGGATFNTTVKCTVSDSIPNNATSGNCVITNTYTLVYPAITATVSTTNGSCSKSICGTSCTAHGSATANPSGGNGSYTYSWSVTAGTGTITAGSTSQTCTVSDTEATTSSPGTSYTTTVQCSVNDTRGTGAVTPSNNVKLTFSCPSG